MKLYELKAMRERDLISIMSSLLDSKQFVKKLGRGAHAIAFELKDGSVLRCWLSDPGYERFIEHCIENKGDSWLIKPLSKVHTFTLRDVEDPALRKVKCVKLEKIKPLTKNAFEKYKPPKNETAESIIEIIQYALTEGNLSFQKMIDLFEEELSLEFGVVLKELYTRLEKFRNGSWGMDLCPRNFGLRGDQIVIVDPLVDEFLQGSEEVMYLDDYLK